MVTIYCIEDINDLKYVGSTKQTLANRFDVHKRNKTCSSKKLNLYYSIIYPLETCNKSNKKERERYWINKLDSVNTNKLNGKNTAENTKRYKHNNKEKVKECQSKYLEKNKDEINLFRRRSFVKECYEFIKMLEEY